MFPPVYMYKNKRTMRPQTRLKQLFPMEAAASSWLPICPAKILAEILIPLLTIQTSIAGSANLRSIFSSIHAPKYTRLRYGRLFSVKMLSSPTSEGGGFWSTNGRWRSVLSVVCSFDASIRLLIINKSQERSGYIKTEKEIEWRCVA